jgi:hypothetical protein
MVAAGALACTAFLSFVLVATDGGRLAYNTRETTALWLGWAARLSPLGEGMPAWYRGREGAFGRDVLVWTVVLLLAYLVARALERWPLLQHRIRYATAVAALFACAASVALTLVWTLGGVERVLTAPAQLELLRRFAREPRLLAAELEPPRVLPGSDVLSMLRIESSPRLAGGFGTGRNEQPLVSLPTIPAGRYRLFTRTRGPGGWLILGVGRDQFALRSQPLAYPPSPIEIELPVDVRALVIRGDEEARRTIRSVALEPSAVVPVAARLTDRVARHAVAYDAANVFFLDEACFPEPEAFWVGGAREGTFVLQPTRPGASVAVQLRNAPVENHVTVQSGLWREELALAPGEERRLDIPLVPGRGAALVSVTTRTGFRPSEHVDGNRDARFLGVWMKVGP